jgi:CheY-like chemotaxis protein
MSERHALVVDDHPTNRLLGSTQLRKLGWLVTEADCGEAALAAAAVRHFDLILLDISMPGLSGEEACCQLRAMASPPGRIIAYTAHAYPEDRERLLAAGFDDILVKPVTRQRMEEAVGSA